MAKFSKSESKILVLDKINDVKKLLPNGEFILEESDLNNINNAITYLNENYPNGLDGGKIIAIGIEDSYKTLFAFNYDYDEIITD